MSYTKSADVSNRSRVGHLDIDQRAPKSARWLNESLGVTSRKRKWVGVIWVLPALAAYVLFVLFPLGQTVRYSFYNWDGIGVATWAGFNNYVQVFTQPELISSIVHSFILIVFFTIIPVFLGLIAASLLQRRRQGAFTTVTRTILFFPQIVPLAGAGIMWSWMYAPNGAVNGLLRAVGLGGLTQQWLGNFNTALPAVGIIGVWLSLGFCTVLFLSGISKVDPATYEAARIDGAGAVREFFAITLPALRGEIVVAVTVTVIAALESFDVIYVSTQGGPGYATMVPGVEIYRLTFLNQHIGAASALAVVLTILVLIVVSIIQRVGRGRD
ncbi:carbohydrate ABC transporter permease [Alicyclobacillus dauci]|uniref:Sugar ABC transporter permease n=1 Tax=Alicyclobacillus dauci TaxID=1475485 RepID=A0ABY6Z2D0_9BACL|nr:sugar ABC transporter permease [Alicyclobacillus dauci]WAH37058.1 sugar ABC transporter permease [Alicyclobacillus dauci]